jgi:predicted DCC family thiol-disulfide oxidoreductase YuxK
MASYRKSNPENRLRFVDISAEGFSAENYDKSKAKFMAQLHVRDAEGVYSTGIDAFLVIWQAYPSGSLYRLFGALVSLPGIAQLSRAGYCLFARYRHLLPKSGSDCASGSCNLNHPQ